MVPRTQKFAGTKQLLWSVAIQIWSGCICSVLHEPLQAPRKVLPQISCCEKDTKKMSILIKFVAAFIPQFCFPWNYVVLKCLSINCPSEACTTECRSARHTTLASIKLHLTGCTRDAVWCTYSTSKFGAALALPFCFWQNILHKDAWVGANKTECWKSGNLYQYQPMSYVLCQWVRCVPSTLSSRFLTSRRWRSVRSALARCTPAPRMVFEESGWFGRICHKK